MNRPEWELFYAELRARDPDGYRASIAMGDIVRIRSESETLAADIEYLAVRLALDTLDRSNK